MENINRLDEIKIVTELLRDLQKKSPGGVFTSRGLRNTQKYVLQRYRSEGLGFLTKSLPRLGKAFDKALTGDIPLTADSVGFKAQTDSSLPLFCGELLGRIFDRDGRILPEPCVESIRMMRDLCYLFYKYEVPFAAEDKQAVIDGFKATERELIEPSLYLDSLKVGVLNYEADFGPIVSLDDIELDRSHVSVILRARYLLGRVLDRFDFTDIVPRHGPGAVATRQKLWNKFLFTNVSERLSTCYPLDAYFFASLGHVCDELHRLKAMGSADLPARVVLVPKDSRGPRLISCEPVDFQWIQQGVMTKLVDHVERHPLTRDHVHFTDQRPNQSAALRGSRDGSYATLDLKEASDRVSVSLVHLLFPETAIAYLEACRSSATELPSGEILSLRKYAPMGSALCFPVLALTVWALITAAAPDADTRERILVYGDDVIVPRLYSLEAIEQLELCGLKVNIDKSCISGFFRESCGMDAFKGTVVTPVRFRTVWSSAPRADVYASWIAYANALYERGYHNAYDYVVSRLCAIYSTIPELGYGLPCPALYAVPDQHKRLTTRVNYGLQRLEFRVRVVKSRSVSKEISGWAMLLRYFTEVSRAEVPDEKCLQDIWERLMVWSKCFTAPAPFSVRRYTPRHASKLAWKWVGSYPTEAQLTYPS